MSCQNCKHSSELDFSSYLILSGPYATLDECLGTTTTTTEEPTTTTTTTTEEPTTTTTTTTEEPTTEEPPTTTIGPSSSGSGSGSGSGKSGSSSGSSGSGSGGPWGPGPEDPWPGAGYGGDEPPPGYEPPGDGGGPGDPGGGPGGPGGGGGGGVPLPKPQTPPPPPPGDAWTKDCKLAGVAIGPDTQYPWQSFAVDGRIWPGAYAACKQGLLCSDCRGAVVRVTNYNGDGTIAGYGGWKCCCGPHAVAGIDHGQPCCKSDADCNKDPNCNNACQCCEPYENDDRGVCFADDGTPDPCPHKVCDIVALNMSAPEAISIQSSSYNVPHTLEIYTAATYLESQQQIMFTISLITYIKGSFSNIPEIIAGFRPSNQEDCCSEAEFFAEPRCSYIDFVVVSTRDEYVSIDAEEPECT